MIDLMRDGVSSTDLRALGDRAVRRALLRTACSARQRGWSRVEWAGEVDSAKSHLGAQAKLKRGRAERSARDFEGLLRGAWDQAGRFLDENPAWTAEQARAEAEARAHALRDLAADPDADLCDNDRAVLVYAAELAMKRGSDRVTIPRGQILAATGLGLTALRLSLARLEKPELLVLVERGRPRGAGAKAKPRANVYRLPTVEMARRYLTRGTRLVVPPAHVSGAPTLESAGAGRRLVVPPDPNTPLPHYVAHYVMHASPEEAAALRARLDAKGSAP
jgi:hypothetical protein